MATSLSSLRKVRIMRPIDYLRKFLNYQHQFGTKEAIKKSIHYLAGRVAPPCHSSYYPTDILWTMEQQPDLLEHIAITKEMNETWLRNPQRPRRVLWVMPDFVSVHNGGPNTILRFAHEFARRSRKHHLHFQWPRASVGRPGSR